MTTFEEKVLAFDMSEYYKEAEAQHEADTFQQAEIEGHPNQAKIMHAHEIKLEPIEWLWRFWLAAAKLVILAGAPGTGKSTLALAIAAILSVGGR